MQSSGGHLSVQKDILANPSVVVVMKVNYSHDLWKTCSGPERSRIDSVGLERKTARDSIPGRNFESAPPESPSVDGRITSYEVGRRCPIAVAGRADIEPVELPIRGIGC